MRLDPSVWPTKQKCATVGEHFSIKPRLRINRCAKVSSLELKQLRSVRSVVRQGRVAALHLDRVEFQNGTNLPRCKSKSLSLCQAKFDILSIGTMII